MAHPGQSARKGNNYVPNDYRPFQCCPTKLERQTRVPKMSAQKLSHKKDGDEKSRGSQFQFGSSGSSSSSSSKPSVRKTETKAKIDTESKYSPAAPAPSKKIASKKPTKNDDDDDDIVIPVKELKKAAAKSKDTNKAKPGQKGLLGIAKIVNWF